MRSIFFKILLWFGVMLAFSITAFISTNIFLARRSVPQDRFINRVMSMQLEEARGAYESGGKEALTRYLGKMDRYFLGKHLLLNGRGEDLVTGDNHMDLLQAARETSRPTFLGRPSILLQRATPDGKYHFLIQTAPTNFTPLNNSYSYTWIALVVILLCYAMAVNFVKPLRQLRKTVLTFGAGDLTARASSARKDEFGDLARAFDDMADRMETLLTSERRLMQDVSHELRSPLARLKFAVELARTSEDRQGSIDRIKRDIELLSGLVSELIHMNQAEGDPAERRVAPVQLAPLLTEVLEDCRIEAEAKRVSLVAPPATRWQVMGDDKLLRRALENVLRNAIRYSPETEQIEITLQKSGGTATVGVRDHGPGVPEEMLKDIFRPFFRVESDRARNTGGTGLGLAIAERSVRLHHGTIQARNASPGLLVEIQLPGE